MIPFNVNPAFYSPTPARRIVERSVNNDIMQGMSVSHQAWFKTGLEVLNSWTEHRKCHQLEAIYFIFQQESSKSSKDMRPAILGKSLKHVTKPEEGKMTILVYYRLEPARQIRKRAGESLQIDGQELTFRFLNYPMFNRNEKSLKIVKSELFQWPNPARYCGRIIIPISRINPLIRPPCWN